MARIVNSTFTPQVVLHVNVVKEDKSVITKEFRTDDEVTNLRYVSNNKICKVSGRIAGVTYSFPNTKLKRYYSTLSKLKSWFRYDVKPESLLVDCSTEKHANVYSIPVREILEDEDEVEVDHIETYLSYGFSGDIEMSDNTTNSFMINEGETVKDLVYLYKGDEDTIASATVVVIKYDKDLNPVGLIMNTGGQMKQILAQQIVSVSDSVSPVSFTSDLAVAIAGNTSGELFVEAGTFSTPLNITKSIVLNGAKQGISATKSTRDRKGLTGETILSGKITLSDDVDLTLDGVALTGEALLSINKAKSVTLKNCIFVGITPTTNRSYLIHSDTGSTKIEIDDCFFGAFKSTNGRIYNLFEMNCKLKDGSSFTNLYFQDGCSVNNDICIYGVEEGATITISNNIWENSANGIRYGAKLAPTANILIANNTYKATPDGEYAGLLLIQPYNKQTTSMAGATIKITNTKKAGNEHIYYMYAGTNDMAFKSDTLPTVYVNGVKTNPVDVYLNYTGIPVEDEPLPLSVKDMNEQITEAAENGGKVDLTLDQSLDLAESETISIPSGADVTVTIPKDMEIKAVANAFTVAAGGKLTLKGNGVIATTTKKTNPAVSVNGGEVIVDGITIDALKETDANNNSAYGIYAANNGKVTVKSGLINTRYGACIGTNNTTGTATIDIQGGELHNDGAYALYFGGNTKTTITGGKVQGINVRMGDITIGGNVEIIGTTIDDSNCDKIGENINTSGCIWFGDTIALVLGTYKKRSETDNVDLTLTIKDNAKVTSAYRAAIGVYAVDTKEEYKARITVNDDKAITTTSGVDALTVYDHDAITADARRASKTYVPTVNGDYVIKVGSAFIPVTGDPDLQGTNAPVTEPSGE